MRRLIFIVISIALISLSVSCGKPTIDPSGDGAKPAPSATPTSDIHVGGVEPSTPPKATTAPQVFSPEQLLSAAELESFVGQPVKASFDSVEVSDTGCSSGYYEYDIPLEGIDVSDTFSTSFYLIQNSMISPSELANGHDAKWAFEDFRKSCSDKAVDLPGLGGAAFYMNNNSDVHVLFQEYYIDVGFRIDSTDFDKNLALNKSIAAYILNKISLDDVSLTP